MSLVSRTCSSSIRSKRAGAVPSHCVALSSGLCLRRVREAAIRFCKQLWAQWAKRGIGPNWLEAAVAAQPNPLKAEGAKVEISMSMKPDRGASSTVTAFWLEAAMLTTGRVRNFGTVKSAGMGSASVSAQSLYSWQLSHQRFWTMRGGAVIGGARVSKSSLLLKFSDALTS